MAKPLSVGLQILGWLIGLYFAVTGQVSQMLGYVILVAMALVSGWTVWHGVKDIRLAYRERKQLKGNLKQAEQEREKLKRELKAAQAKMGSALGYEKLVAELERVRSERDEFERELTIRKRNEPLRDWHLKNEAKWEYIREANLSEIEELKQRCLGLATELHQFLEQRGHEATDILHDSKTQQRSDETVELYREHFMDKVNALRKDLERHKLRGLGVIDLHEQDMAKNPTNYLTIRAIAGHINAIGNRL